MSKKIHGFIEFVKNHSVVGLAVGLAIGTQVGNAVRAIVENLINPVVGFLIGDADSLETLSYTVTAGNRTMTIGWGAVISALITLLAVSAVIYWVVKVMKLEKLEKKKG